MSPSPAGKLEGSDMEAVMPTGRLQDRLPALAPALARLARGLFDARLNAPLAALGLAIAPAPATPAIRPARLRLRCCGGELETVIDVEPRPALESAALPADAAVRAALAGTLLAPLFERLAAAGLPALEVAALDLLADGEALPGLGLAVRAGGGGATLRFTAADRRALTLLEHYARDAGAHWPQPLPAALAALLLPGRARIGARRCTPALLRSLRPGDVLLNWSPAGAGLATPARPQLYWGAPRALQYAATARLDHRTLTLESLPAMQLDDHTLPPDPYAEAEAPAVGVAALELPVTLEIATMVLAVEQLAALQPGQVLELPLPLDQTQIRLVAYGQTLGYGQLLMVGEQLGLQISRMADVHEPDA
ncbi:YscQ/HrcQ family type III secretion apparatus protein [Duganella sp. BJB488]|nr:YscQ/HrcQ family type III secretion apparatus protein [Duganella sp. BJB489]RFP17187.1 YscQ/HrcQ family type III secretion apparatus protein [Duganella sp. BJB488]RFP31593.1 YscQ/HrcQ family type III secretion apparatus protein [Duganella sp. BJB480]